MSDHDTLSQVQYLYLTTTGRRTGQPRQIEIWFVMADGRFYVLAERFHQAQWIKNILHDPRVRVRVGEHEFDATARVLDADRDGEAWQSAQQLAQHKYGWGAGLPVEITPVEPLLPAGPP